MSMIEGGVFASSDGHVPEWAQDDPNIEVPAADMGADFESAVAGPQISGPQISSPKTDMSFD